MHEEIKVLCGGPTWLFLKHVAFGQCRDLVRAARGRYQFPDPDALFLDMTQPGGPGRWIAGLSTKDINAASGYKSRRLIVYLDEAAGVDAEAWSAIDGLTASGDVQVIVNSQPHTASGPFFDACHGRGSPYHVVHMDCFDSPNLLGLTEESLRACEPDDPRLDVIRHPNLVKVRWVYEAMARLSPSEWAAKVRGRFPDDDETVLFPLSLLYRARDAVAAPWHGQVSAGLDVAGPGRNKTVLVIRGGGAILAMHKWREADPRGLVLAALRPWRDRLAMLHGDAGGLGYHFMTWLRGEKVPVEFVNFGSGPRDTERFANLRAEMYYGVRDRLVAGEVSGLTDEDAISQFAAITDDPAPNGKSRLSSKATLRAALGGDSTDEADAVVLAFRGAGKNHDAILAKLFDTAQSRWSDTPQWDRL